MLYASQCEVKYKNNYSHVEFPSWENYILNFIGKNVSLRNKTLC